MFWLASVGCVKQNVAFGMLPGDPGRLGASWASPWAWGVLCLGGTLGAPGRTWAHTRSNLILPQWGLDSGSSRPWDALWPGMGIGPLWVPPLEIHGESQAKWVPICAPCNSETFDVIIAVPCWQALRHTVAKLGALVSNYLETLGHSVFGPALEADLPEVLLRSIANPRTLLT